MFGRQWTTKQKLIRNLVFACLAFLLIWAMAGMPSLTVKGAFRQAMQENLTPQVKPEVILKSDYGCAVLGKDEGVWYQVAVVRKWWIFWDHYEAVGETVPEEDICLVPLFLKEGILHTKRVLIGYWEIPDVAVLAEGDSATLRVETDESRFECEPLGKQDGWFLFSYSLTGSQAYSSFINSQSPYLDRPEPSPGSRYWLHGSFLFESYDADGSVLQQGNREF